LAATEEWDSSGGDTDLVRRCTRLLRRPRRFAFVGALGLLRRPTRRDWPIILSNGILQLALFFALGNLVLRYIPAGRSAVLAYTTTLWLVPLEALAGGSRLDLWCGLGLFAGLSGVAVLLNPLPLD
jgi:drug/metabolite transporter (DMT)-like permease